MPESFEPLHLQVPRDRGRNAEYRIALTDWLNASDGETIEARRRLRVQRRSAFWHACRQDILLFVNSCLWLLEPRKTLRMPWCTWDFQDESLLMLRDAALGAMRGVKCDIIQPKSRDVGASWMCCTLVLHFWLFHKVFSALLLSRKADLVESSDPKSLFAKIDMLIAALPKWMLPRRWYRASMTLINHDMSSTITGDSTQNFSGVADRTTMIVLDEFSLMEQQSQIWKGTTAVTNFRIANFTVRGFAVTANALVRKARRGDSPHLKLNAIHWTRHPEHKRGMYQFRDGKLHKFDDYPFPDDYPFVLDGRMRSLYFDEYAARCATLADADSELDMIEGLPNGACFEPRVLAEIREQRCRPPLFRGDIIGGPEAPLFTPRTDGPLHCWHPLRDDRPPIKEYVIGADIGGGSGASNSVLSVWERYTGRHVASYVTNMVDPQRFAHVAASLCWWYADTNGGAALLKPEANGPTGSGFIRELLHVVKFGNVFYRRRERDVDRKTTKQAGWFSTNEEKGVIIRGLAVGLKNGRALTQDADLVQECGQYTYDSRGVPQHVDLLRDMRFGTAAVDESDTGATPDSGQAHGDRTIAAALGFSACELPEIARPLAGLGPDGRPDVRTPEGLMLLVQEHENKQRRQPYWRRERYTRRWNKNGGMLIIR